MMHAVIGGVIIGQNDSDSKKRRFRREQYRDRYDYQDYFGYPYDDHDWIEQRNRHDKHSSRSYISPNVYADLLSFLLLEGKSVNYRGDYYFWGSDYFHRLDKRHRRSHIGDYWRKHKNRCYVVKHTRHGKKIFAAPGACK